MPASLNKVLLIGNLTRDVELKYTSFGVAVANFGLAINRSYVNFDGERVDDVCFVDVIAWDGLAEICSEYLTKGGTVFVEGRLQYRSWEAEACPGEGQGWDKEEQIGNSGSEHSVPWRAKSGR